MMIVLTTRLPGKSPTSRKARQVPRTSLSASEASVNWSVLRSARWKIELSQAETKLAGPTKAPPAAPRFCSVTANQSASRNG